MLKHPELQGKVVQLADIRAWRLNQLEVEQAYAQAKADGEDLMAGLNLPQRVFWMNQQFFANRLCGEAGFNAAGRIAFSAGDLVVQGREPALALYFNCEAYEAYYHLTERLTINWDIDPLMVRWSCVGEPEFAVLSRTMFTYTPRANHE